jgi:ribosomal-protein-serine acetyltransferase
MRELLSDGVITLQRYTLQDVDDLHNGALESVAEVYPWLPWCRQGYTREEAASWIAAAVKSWDERRNFEFVIRTASGDHVGGAGINSLHEEQPMANLGYWVRSSQLGKGYATRAARLLGDFGIHDMKLQRVEIVVAVTNNLSLRVAQKAGAVREGILRNRIVLHGQPHDAVMHSFIPAP